MSFPVEKPRAARRPGRILAVSALLGVVLSSAACSAAPPGSVAPPSSAPASASASIPPDGIGLRGLGISHGPAAFSVPVTSQFMTTADQPQSVTLVITSPAPAEVQAYLEHALPAGGFTVSKQARDAIVFSGYGWGGSFVITGDLSAVTLQDDKASGRTGRG